MSIHEAQYMSVRIHRLTISSVGFRLELNILWLIFTFLWPSFLSCYTVAHTNASIKSFEWVLFILIVEILSAYGCCGEYLTLHISVLGGVCGSPGWKEVLWAVREAPGIHTSPAGPLLGLRLVLGERGLGWVVHKVFHYIILLQN